MQFMVWVTMKEKNMILKISHWIPNKLKGLTLFSMVFYNIQAQRGVDFIIQTRGQWYVAMD